MRRAPPLLLLLLATVAASEPPQVNTNESIDTLISNDTIVVDNENGTLVLRDVNGTVIELDGSPEEVVRKKRTFGDIVFRGLADVLGYSVARKPPQAAFPPPLAPVPGIDAPLAGPAQAPPPAPAQAPPPAPAPCGQPRAASPPPCRAPRPPPPPPQPKAVPPCPKPRAAPRPRPKPTPPPPPPPPPPPCAQPRANPTTPAPCAPPPPPPPPKQADNLERITSNLRLNFNFNRGPVAPATPAPATQAVAQEEAEAEFDNQEQYVPIAIEPQAARLPQTEPRKPRVYVDAFVVRNGVARRVDTVDAKQFDARRANADDDYLAYDDDTSQQQADDDDDYEDVQESRDREAAVQQFGNAVDQFWQHKKKQKKPSQQKARRLPENHYQKVHFGDRDLPDNNIRQRGDTHQSLQRERAHSNRIPLPLPDAEDDAESTTTTEDPRKPLKPRVLPPTEHNPNQIDTVTVRVPPIYREKRPRKLHRERPEEPRRDDDNEEPRSFSSQEREYEQDTDGDDSSLDPRTERPAKRKRRRKQSRKTRSADDEQYTAGDYDYYGNKFPTSKEEKFYMDLTVPPPTLDADVARHEKPVESGYFLDDHERLREDPSQRIRDEDKSEDDEHADDSERADDRERSNEEERSEEDKERTGEEDRSDEKERTDKLSPNAHVRETGYKKNYVRATNVQVDDPRPAVASVKRKQVAIGQASPAT